MAIAEARAHREGRREIAGIAHGGLGTGVEEEEIAIGESVAVEVIVQCLTIDGGNDRKRDPTTGGEGHPLDLRSDVGLAHSRTGHPHGRDVHLHRCRGGTLKLENLFVALDVALIGVDIDLVISGANAGENLGLIANHSGTVSAAMRAVRRGYPAIAISVATDLKNMYMGYKLMQAGDYSGGMALIQLAEANQLAAMDDAGALVVSIVNRLECTAALPWNRGRLMPEGIGLNVNIPAKETADFSGVLFTKSDNASIIDLTFEEGDNPGEVKVTANLDDFLKGVLFGQLPADGLNLDSEGEANIGGYATISPMDGNWSSIGSFFKGISMKSRLGDIVD